MICSPRRAGTCWNSGCSTRCGPRGAGRKSCSLCSVAGWSASRRARAAPCCGSPRPSRRTRSGRRGWTWRSTICWRLSPACGTASRPSPTASRCRMAPTAPQPCSASLRPGRDAAAEGAPAVRWLERRGRKGANLSLAAVPLDLASVLKDALFDRVETVVLTSATLASGNDFGFLEDRLGLSLPPSRVVTREILPSPFDFVSQCLFGIPTDVPEPRDDADGHDAAVARVLIELAHAADGGVFCLFTSHRALRRTAETVRGRIGGRWPLLVQGEDQRDRLLRRFRESGSAVLLGTDSFWEGVDVPGRALRVLILSKLPFKVPSEPLTAARVERLEQQGLDGFSHYLVPLAGLKLKQGFGRLIRSLSDVGSVVLLDRRAVTKRYGVRILEGLPRATRVVANWEDIRDACEEFFARHATSLRV